MLLEPALLTPRTNQCKKFRAAVSCWRTPEGHMQTPASRAIFFKSTFTRNSFMTDDFLKEIYVRFRPAHCPRTRQLFSADLSYRKSPANSRSSSSEKTVYTLSCVTSLTRSTGLNIPSRYVTLMLMFYPSPELVIPSSRYKVLSAKEDALVRCPPPGIDVACPACDYAPVNIRPTLRHHRL